jgi:hypothetical protein
LRQQGRFQHNGRGGEGVTTLGAIPLFNTPINGMPAPANRVHAAKNMYERIVYPPAQLTIMISIAQCLISGS